jgi:hypothetical protein
LAEVGITSLHSHPRLPLCRASGNHQKRQWPEPRQHAGIQVIKLEQASWLADMREDDQVRLFSQ